MARSQNLTQKSAPLRIEAMFAQEMNNRTYLTIVTLFYFLNPPFNTKLQLFL